MEITSKTVDAIPIVILKGHFDAYEVQRVSESILHALIESKYLIVNLQEAGTQRELPLLILHKKDLR